MRTSKANALGGAAVLLAAAAVSVGCLPGCGDDENGGAGGGAKGSGGLALSSAAFSHNGAIPAKYGFQSGHEPSPPLEWSGVPEGTKSLVLIVDDPDAGGFTHWLVYNVPPSAGGLKEGIPKGHGVADPAGAMQGTPDGPGQPAYVGMDPPPGETHHYHFTLYALDTTLNLGPGPDKEKLQHMIAGHVLDKVTLIGTYRK